MSLNRFLIYLIVLNSLISATIATSPNLEITIDDEIEPIATETVETEANEDFDLEGPVLRITSNDAGSNQEEPSCCACQDVREDEKPIKKSKSSKRTSSNEIDTEEKSSERLKTITISVPYTIDPAALQEEILARGETKCVSPTATTNGVEDLIQTSTEKSPLDSQDGKIRDSKKGKNGDSLKKNKSDKKRSKRDTTKSKERSKKMNKKNKIRK